MDGRRFALLLEYDGTAFAGSQLQPAVRTVQEVVEAALGQFTGRQTRIALAGRTDTGVHALGQVAALDIESAHAPGVVRDALNHFLPEDVAVRAAAEVAAGFDPRRHAVSRTYRYRIQDGQARSPLTRHRTWQVERPLDVTAMAEALALLPVGVARDWAAFSGAVAEGYTTVRTLLDATVERCAPHTVEVMLEADAFLPHQVRMMVGTLQRVGVRRLTPPEFAAMLDGPAASAASAAPPQGLTLVAVRYPPGTIEWGN